MVNTGTFGSRAPRNFMLPPDNLRPQGVSLNLTPMIDVVFLLIIFFIVSSTMVQQDVSLKLELPEAASGEQFKESETRKITVNIPQPGTMLLGTEPIDPDGFRTYLLRERQLAAKGLEVRIRTDRNVPYGTVEPILVLCAESGVWNVSFSVAKSYR